MSEEMYPVNWHDPALPPQDDIKSILGSLALILKNAELAYEHIEKGEYEHRDLRQACF